MAPTPRPPPTEDQLKQAEACKQKGNDAFRAKNYTEALRHYTEAISITPESETLYSNRSAAYLSLERLSFALNDAKRAVELNPKWAKAYRRKASVLDAMKRYQEARIVYEQALKVLTDEATDEAVRKRETDEVEALLATVTTKMKEAQIVDSNKIKITRMVERQPGYRIFKESERKVREDGLLIGEWPPVGTCFRQLWLAEMQFQNALLHVWEFDSRPIPGIEGPGMIFGRLQTLEEVTSALIEDNRVGRFEPKTIEKLSLVLTLEQQSRYAVGPESSPKKTIEEYNRRLTEPPNQRPAFLRQLNTPAATALGWDYVRPALQLSVRSALVNGLIGFATQQEHHGTKDFTRAAELVQEARKQWPDVDGSLRGRTLDETFYRQINILLGEALLQHYMEHTRNRSRETNEKALDKIHEIAEWAIESVTRAPKPSGPDHPGDRIATMRWWGMYYNHYASPMARAYSLLGFVHLHRAGFGRQELKSPTTGAGGPLVDEPNQMAKAAYAYARSAAWFPYDEPNRCNSLWYCVFAMVRRGGYYLADFEVIRDMAGKCPEYYREYFPENCIPAQHGGKVMAGEMEGSIVGSPPDQICSPLVEWPQNVDPNQGLLNEVIAPWTVKLVKGEGQGLLKCARVIQEEWAKRLAIGEVPEQLGGDKIWGDLSKETRENWDKVWAEHLTEGNPTFEG